MALVPDRTGRDARRRALGVIRAAVRGRVDDSGRPVTGQWTACRFGDEASLRRVDGAICEIDRADGRLEVWRPSGRARRVVGHLTRAGEVTPVDRECDSSAWGLHS